MTEKLKDLFRILPEIISEDLFIQKIGTRDLLIELEEQGIVERTGCRVRIIKLDWQSNAENVDPQEQKRLHNDLIHSYYIPKVQLLSIVEFDDLSENVDYYLNLSFHYMCLEQFDEAIQQIFAIAKKLHFWGMRDLLIEELNKVPSERLSNNNRLIKELFLMFTDVYFWLGRNHAIEEAQEKFSLLSQLKEIDRIYYYEARNLEGIYYRVFEKDGHKALGIHQETIELMKAEKTGGYNDKVFCTMMGRLYENLSFCHEEKKDEEYAKQALENARKCFDQTEDFYELAKLYLYKTMLYYSADPNELTWLHSVNELKELLNLYRFPDVERNFCNLIARIEMERTGDLCRYFSFKRRAIECSLVLYNNNFAADFIDVYNFISMNKAEKKEMIAEELDGFIEILRASDMEDEMYFIMTIKEILLGNSWITLASKIQNKSLGHLIEQIIKV